MRDNQTVAYRAVLFDLDGTLIDTAADLGAAANHVLDAHRLPLLTTEVIRQTASHGALGLLKAGFGDRLEDYDVDSLRQMLLDYYDAHIAIHSRAFDGIAALLDAFAARSVPWGIVTNKPGWLTTKLLATLPEFASSGVTISGDTLPVRKPDPAPLLHACKRLQSTPEQTLYVGDAARDMEAGKRAGMGTVAVHWGYFGPQDAPHDWPADHWIAHPEELLGLLDSR